MKDEIRKAFESITIGTEDEAVLFGKEYFKTSADKDVFQLAVGFYAGYKASSAKMEELRALLQDISDAEGITPGVEQIWEEVLDLREENRKLREQVDILNRTPEKEACPDGTGEKPDITKELLEEALDFISDIVDETGHRDGALFLTRIKEKS